MLTFLRDKITGWLATVIVAVLVISFTFFGVSFYLGQESAEYVASVNGKTILAQNFQHSYTNIRRQMQSNLGQQLTREEDALIRSQTLEYLIDAELLNQLADRLDLRVTDIELLSAVERLFRTEENTKIDKLGYAQLLRQMGVDDIYFEHLLRMDILAEQLRFGIKQSNFLLSIEENDLARLSLQQRDITYALIDSNEITDEEITITDEVINSYYRSNLSQYMTNPKAKIAYIELDAKVLADDIVVDESLLREYYSENKDYYDEENKRSFQQLSININEKMDAEKARMILEPILNELRQSDRDLESFVNDSSDNLKKDFLQFNERLLIEKNKLDPEIDAFLFANDEGQISDIISSKNKLSIIKVTEIQGNINNHYEHVAERVEADYRQEQAELEFFELLDELSILSYENSDDLQTVASQMNLEVKQSDYLTQRSLSSEEIDNDTIFSNPKLTDSVFNPELYHSQKNSSVIEIEDDHVIVFRILDYQDAKPIPLDEIRVRLVEDLLAQKKIEMINHKGESIVAQLKSGKTIDMLENDAQVEWMNAKKVQRDDLSVRQAILRMAFDLGKPKSDDGYLASGRLLGSDEYAIVIVTRVDDEGASIDGVITSPKLDFVSYAYVEGEWSQLLQTIKDQADIERFMQNMDG